MSQPSIVALAHHIRSQQARCGSTRVILIDGPAGAGKTTLANCLVEELGGAASPGAGIVAPSIAPDVRAQVLHGDDMYEGWEGLATLNDVLCGQVLEPLARGEVASFRAWDWVHGRRGHKIVVPPRPFLIIEGVDVANARAQRHAAAVLWVEAPLEARLARARERDGHMEGWQQTWRDFEQEADAAFAASGARERAAFVIDGSQTVPHDG